MENVVSKAHLWIKFPETPADIQAAKQEWQERFSFPCAIGALDCTHVKIMKPANHGDEFINRKGLPTINVQATCNAREMFTSVNAKWPGSVHDSRIWKTSNECVVMSRGIGNALLLGDEGYGIMPWLLTPFKNPDTPEEKLYNKVFTKERVIIERCFGQLKRRFPILHYKVRVALHKAASIIICCFVLHNVAKYLKDNADFPELMNDDDDSAEEPIEPDNDNLLRARGQQRRINIAQILYSNV